MISPDLIVVAAIGGFGLLVGFCSYWRGVSAGQSRSAERIEQLLDDLDFASAAMRSARERHPAGRELRLVREDDAS